MGNVLYGGGSSGNVLTDISSATMVFYKLGSTTETTTKYSYTGFPIMPGPVVTLGQTVLTPDVDYRLEYSDNVEKGTATVRVIGKGSYEGVATSTFTIERTLADATIVVSPLTYVYDGTEKIPEHVYVVYHDGSNLVENVDYTVAYSGSVNAGLGLVTVTGIGEFAGTTKTAQYIISRRNIAGSTATLPYQTPYQTYNGTAFTPTPTVVDRGTTLVEDTDYEVIYETNVNPGIAKVVIKGLGNYNGSLTLTFIIKGDLNSAFATVSFPQNVASYEYTGSEIKPQVSVTFASSITLSASDFSVAYANNVNAAAVDAAVHPTATVTAAENSYYFGSKTVPFAITRKNISSATVTFPKDKYPYLGTAVTPSGFTVSIMIGETATTLVLNQDYTISSWSNNNGPGTGSVVLSGSGNYTGDVTGTFVIVSPRFEDATVVLGSTQETYTGSAITPSVTSVTLYGDTLVENTHYTVSYADNVNAGQASVIISPVPGSGYAGAGTVTVHFIIVQKSLAGATVTVLGGPFVYNGAPHTPLVTAVLDGVTLTGSDYTLSYQNNTDATQQATVVVTGKGNYTGTEGAIFAITTMDISSFAVKLPYEKYLYTGSAITPIGVQVSSVVSGNVITIPETDYDLSYSSNTAIGTATVTATGKRNCSGTTSATFPIVERDISNCLIQFKDNVTEYTYNGTSVTPEYSVDGGSFVLALGTDYTVQWINNDRTGSTACLKVTGNQSTSDGHLPITGFVYVYFQINPMALTASNVTAVFDSVARTQSLDAYALECDNGNSFSISSGITSMAPDGFYYYWKENGVHPSVTGYLKDINNGRATFQEGTDYDVEFSDNLSVGEGTVKIVAKSGTGLPNRYTGSVSFNFYIRKNLADVSMPPLPTLSYSASKIDLYGLIIDAGLTFGTDTLRIGWNLSNPKQTDMLLIGASEEIPYSTTSSDKLQYGIPMYQTGAADVGTYSVYLYPWMGTNVRYDKVPADEADPCRNVTVPALYVPKSLDSSHPSPSVTGYFGWKFNSSFCNRLMVSATIVPVDITSCTISDSSPIKIGAPFELSPSVSSFSPAVNLTGTKTGDYTTSYLRNNLPGEASAVLTSSVSPGNLFGTRTDTFSIYLSSSYVRCLASQVSFTGFPIEPDMACDYQPVSIQRGSDFEVSYSSNTAVGTATATATGWPFFSGISKSFSIVENPFTSSKKYSIHRLDDGVEIVEEAIGDNPHLTVVLGSLCYKADGSTEHEPSVYVAYDGRQLTAWTHFYLAYSNTKDPGVGFVNLIGKGGFTGTVKRSVRVLPSDFSGTDIGGHWETDTEHPYTVVSDSANPFTTNKEIVDQTYTGSPVEPSLVVRFVGTDLVKDTDYTAAFTSNTAIGTATATITGIGQYAGSTDIVKTFRIVGDISSAFGEVTVEVDDTEVTSSTPEQSFDYSGSKHSADVVVKFTEGGVTTTLVKDTDYTVKSTGERGPGTGTVVITGIGSYCGSVTRKYFIVGGFALTRQDSSPFARIASVTPFSYTPTLSANPTPTVVYDGVTLKSLIDVTYSRPNANLPGQYSVTATGVSPYSGTLTTQFYVQVSFDDTYSYTEGGTRKTAHYLTVDPIPDQTYTGSAITPTVVVKFSAHPDTDGPEDIVTVASSNYTVAYSNNTEKGRAFVRVTMNGGPYVGTYITHFDIKETT